MYPNVTAAAALSNYTLGGWRRENPHQTTLKKGRDDSYTTQKLVIGQFHEKNIFFREIEIQCTLYPKVVCFQFS